MSAHAQLLVAAACLRPETRQQDAYLLLVSGGSDTSSPFLGARLEQISVHSLLDIAVSLVENVRSILAEMRNFELVIQ